LQLDTVDMKNITVSVEEDVYHRARIRAAEQKTSVSAIVRRLLEEVAQEKTEFERLRELEEATIQGMRGPRFSASNRLDRESLHRRDALR
jgi:predicted CopG family antitoxin